MCFLDMQMFRRSRTKHISMCIKNIKKINTCDLKKSKITNRNTTYKQLDFKLLIKN
jgi:hypothetical protein